MSFWGEPKGIFTASVITAVLAAIFISIGMRGYAKLQKLCFYSGMPGLLIIFGLLIFHSKERVHRGVQPLRERTYHATTPDAYAATLKKGDYAARDRSAASRSGRRSC